MQSLLFFSFFFHVILFYIFIFNPENMVICDQFCINIVSLNPVDGEVYSIQHYVKKFVSDL
jgi:hypothetical protein